MSRTKKRSKGKGCKGCPQCRHNRPERQLPAPAPGTSDDDYRDDQILAKATECYLTGGCEKCRSRKAFQDLVDASEELGVHQAEMATDEEIQKILDELEIDHALERRLLQENGD